MLLTTAALIGVFVGAVMYRTFAKIFFDIRRHRSLHKVLGRSNQLAVPYRYPLSSVNYQAELNDVQEQIRVWHRFHPFASGDEEDLQVLLRHELQLKRIMDANWGYDFRPDDESGPREGEGWRN